MGRSEVGKNGLSSRSACVQVLPVPFINLGDVFTFSKSSFSHMRYKDAKTSIFLTVSL